MHISSLISSSGNTKHYCIRVYLCTVWMSDEWVTVVMSETLQCKQAATMELHREAGAKGKQHPRSPSRQLTQAGLSACLSDFQAKTWSMLLLLRDPLVMKEVSSSSHLFLISGNIFSHWCCMKPLCFYLAFAKYVGDFFFSPQILQSSPFQHHVTVVEKTGFLPTSRFQNQRNA